MPAEAVLRALKHAWVTLEPLQLPMALMGGLALAVWKHVRATQDVDLLIGLGQAEVGPLVQTLAQAGFRTRRQPAVLDLGSLRILQLLYEPPGAFLDLQVDLLLADSEYHRQALARRVPARLPDLNIEVFVLSCEDLVLHKMIAGRIIDRIDAVALLRANRDGMDLAYLLAWVTRLQLGSAWLAIWQEAFPGEPSPGPA